MPNVPVISLPRVRSGSLPTPDVTSSPPNAAQQLGAAVQGAGANLQVLADKVRETVNHDVMTDLNSKMNAWEDENVTSLQNPNSAFNQKEENAKNLTPRFEDMWKKFLPTISKDLTADQQRLFAGLSTRHWEQTSKLLNHHERQQYELLSQKTYDAGLDSVVNTARQRALPPDGSFNEGGMRTTMADGYAIINRRADLNGWSKEQRDFELKKLSTRVNVQVIMGLKDQNIGEAWRYFMTHQKELDFNLPGVKELEGSLRAAAIKAQALALANDLRTNNPETRGSLSAQLSKLDEYANQPVTEKTPAKYSPEVIDLARGIVNRDDAEIRKARLQGQFDISERIKSRIAPDPFLWSPATDPDLKKIYASPYYSDIFDYWERKKRERLNDKQSKDAQKTIDRVYVRRFKAGLLTEDPEITAPKSWEDPALRLKVTNGLGQPSEEAIAQSVKDAADYEKRTKEGDYGNYIEIYRKAWAEAASWQELTDQESRKAFVAAVMKNVMDAKDADPNHKYPDSKVVAETIAKMKTFGWTDPDRFIFRGWTPGYEAYRSGDKIKKPGPPEEQPGGPPLPKAAPGTVRLRNKATGEVVVRKRSTWDAIKDKYGERWEEE